MRLSIKILCGTAGVALMAYACGGGGSPAGPEPAVGQASSAKTLTDAGPSASPSPTPTEDLWQPPGLEGCALGLGSIHGTCGHQDSQLLASVDAAIESVVAAHPELVDTADVAAPGAYRVSDPVQFFDQLLTTLRAGGMCADYDGETVQVKSSNDLSEEFDLLLSSEHLRRGAGSYLETCNPAAFPVDPQQIINRIWVGVYSFNCGDRTPPRMNEGVFPLGCIAQVTATPKQIDGSDVPPRLHGPDIQWELYQDGLIVDIYDDPAQPFNQTLETFSPGPFRLCATVQGVEGCLDGEVVP